MAVTQLALLFIGALAFVATLGLFYRFGDRWTGILVEGLAAVLWGLLGLSAMDVIVRQSSFASASEPIWPLVFLGIGMALGVGLYAVYDIVEGVGRTANETDLEGMGPR
jgi:phosphate/sulfate permease